MRLTSSPLHISLAISTEELIRSLGDAPGFGSVKKLLKQSGIGGPVKVCHL